jgi:hypothetical protein
MSFQSHFSKLLVAATMTSAVVLAVPSISEARPASNARPTVSSLAATATSATEVASTSPLVLYISGGAITLSAIVSNAVTCTFRSNKSLAGLPVTLPCSSGEVTTAAMNLPANTRTKRDVVYRFHLTVTGSRTVRAIPVTVVVGTQTQPPGCIEPGSTWKMAIPAIGYQALETFGTGFTFILSDSSFGEPDQDGTYTGGGSDGSLMEALGNETFSGSWNGTQYAGLTNVLDAGNQPFTLIPLSGLGADC